MNQLDLDYQNLLRDILDNGVEKDTRNGKVLSVFGRTIRHKMNTGFPLLTTKKMYFKGIVTELLWFLNGDTNIKYLLDNNCNIWNGDCYQQYLKSSKEDNKLSEEDFINRLKNDNQFLIEYGELGPIYGAQWREWIGSTFAKTNIKDPFTNDETYIRVDKHIDQIVEIIKELKENPDSRRMLVNAWNPVDLPDMCLPPCHYSWQVYTRKLSLDERKELFFKKFGETIEDYDARWEINSTYEEDMDFTNIPKRSISLLFNMRSNDVGLGLPFNIASYGLLLVLLGNHLNMVPEDLIANLGDAHIYSNQIDGLNKQLTRIPYSLPTVKLTDKNINDISEYTIDDIKLENYISHSTIKLPLSN